MLTKWEQLDEKLRNDEVKKYYDILSNKRGSLLSKRIFDIVVSLLMIVILSPVLLFISIWIKTDSKGPVFYRQVRVTKNNKDFRIFKFRTMIQDADKYVEKNWQLLLDELEDAKAVMDDPDAMDDTIQPAEDELLNAILAQKYKANKDNLKELVESLKNLDLTKYTEESVKVFEEAMAQADVILADETLSADDQDKVDAAVEELTAARDGLVEKTDGSGDEGGDGDTGNSGDEGNEGNTGNSGDEGNEGNTGNSGDDSNKENIGQENGNEDSGTDGTANKAPKTGDNTPLTMALFFMVLSAGTAVCVIRRKTK